MRKEVIPGYGDGCADHVWRIIKGVCEEHQESVDPERTKELRMALPIVT